MPVIAKSSFIRHPLLFNGHLETIYPALFRRINDLSYLRERIELADGDFLDLDWLENQSDNLVIISHGLEGNSSRQYVAGMSRFFNDKKWDVLAWNCRSCSGEMNRHFRMYHHGEINDIQEVVEYALQKNAYQNVVLIGFSMGANISLKYLGVHGSRIPSAIMGCVAFSAPTDLEAGAEILNKTSNTIYRKRFLKYLKRKLEEKSKMFPGRIDLEKFSQIRVWRDFDEFFSAPMNGYKNASAFYKDASAKNFMPGIRVSTLLVQAQNDPILPQACYPVELCKKLPGIHLEMPKHGGHVGFWKIGERYAWSEKRAWEFIQKHF